jgi:pyridoxine 5'-phosphate synthase PdxJ
MEIKITIVSEGEVVKLIHSKLDAIISGLSGLHDAVNKLTTEVKKMSTQLDALEAQVAKNTDVEASAVILIQGIAAQLEAAKEDPAKVAALAAQLKGSADALATAVTSNTPAETPV